MNRIFRFKMAVRTGLIITLLLAVVMVAGCPKKQDNASAPASSDKKSPKQDTQIESPAVEANGPGVVITLTEPNETTADKTPPKAADTKPAMQQKAPSPKAADAKMAKQAPSSPQLEA
ncbi:MAG TPA: hypothetical protein VIK28_09185, partial [Sedimentisphaerales bacterium]